MNARDHRVRHRVAAESKTKVVRCAHEHILNLGCDLIIYTIEAEVEMFELRASLQEPVRSFVSVSITGHFLLHRVENGDWLFGLLLLLQLFVFLDDGVSLFQLTLIGFYLVGW